MATRYINPEIPETRANKYMKLFLEQSYGTSLNFSNAQTKQECELMGTYASRNKPASLKHFTLVVLGKKSLNSSQCKMDAKPPAEHPERRA